MEHITIPVGTSLAEVERAMVIATLMACGGNKRRAALVLGISLKTIYNKLNAWGLVDGPKGHRS